MQIASIILLFLSFHIVKSCNLHNHDKPCSKNGVRRKQKDIWLEPGDTVCKCLKRHHFTSAKWEVTCVRSACVLNNGTSVKIGFKISMPEDRVCFCAPGEGNMKAIDIDIPYPAHWECKNWKEEKKKHEEEKMKAELLTSAAPGIRSF